MILKPFGPLILHETVSEDFLKFLVDASVETKNKSENVGWDLAGNIEDQLQSVIDPQRFVKEIYPHILSYLAACFDRRKEDMLGQSDPPIANVSFNCGNGPWINFQKKNEFNPVHVHGGELSSVIMIDVPEEIAKESDAVKDKTNMPCPGQLEFIDGTSGYMYTGTYKVVPKTGDIFVFPAQLKHTVYPFTSDVTRITMSYNIMDVSIDSSIME